MASRLSRTRLSRHRPGRPEQPAPPPPPRWVFETLPPWEKLEEGLQLGLFSAQFDGGDPFEVVFLRIDPLYFDFTVETASSEKQSLPLEAWATRKGPDRRHQCQHVSA